jgi:hypothetical protein
MTSLTTSFAACVIGLAVVGAAAPAALGAQGCTRIASTAKADQDQATTPGKAENADQDQAAWPGKAEKADQDQASWPGKAENADQQQASATDPCS